MQDLMFQILLFGFFALCALYVYFADRKEKK
jgi:hypothetical protein